VRDERRSWSVEVSLEGAGAQCVAASGARVLVGTRGHGALLSVDGGERWEEIELPERDVFSVAIGAADGALYAGTEPSRVFVAPRRGWLAGASRSPGHSLPQPMELPAAPLDAPRALDRSPPASRGAAAGRDRARRPHVLRRPSSLQLWLMSTTNSSSSSHGIATVFGSRGSHCRWSVHHRPVASCCTRSHTTLPSRSIFSPHASHTKTGAEIAPPNALCVRGLPKSHPPEPSSPLVLAAEIRTQPDQEHASCRARTTRAHPCCGRYRCVGQPGRRLLSTELMPD
jgi:hypothetical protein